jgi:glycosyltransferase involved in cell wall biosynthesis
VGLNLIYLVPGETGGMEVVARELLPELVRVAPGVRFTAFINREAAAAGDGPWGEILPAVTVPVKATNRPQWVAGDQALLPPMAARRRVDLLHSLASIAPAWGPFKRVVTVHDLIYARFPETHAGLRDKGMRVLVPLAIRSAHRITVDARSTGDDLVQLLGTPRERIDVVPLGLGTPRRHEPAPEAQVRERLGLDGGARARRDEGVWDDEGARGGDGARGGGAGMHGGDGEQRRRVVLSLSAKRPHKNLAALIRALALLPQERRPVLVLPGYPTEHESLLRALAAARGVAESVRFQAWLSPQELEGLWALADAFVFPSLYEGFGLPVLEAMNRGVPVACSDASSLPEVAGDAALLFDPHNDEAIAQALERVLYDATLRETLIVRGHARAREFTWERTARGMLLSYARALGYAEVPSAWTAAAVSPLS